MLLLRFAPTPTADADEDSPSLALGLRPVPSLLLSLQVGEGEVLVDALLGTLKECAARIDDFRSHHTQLGEENTKAALIEPVLKALGWDTSNPDEVHHEYRRLSNDNPVATRSCFCERRACSSKPRISGQSRRTEVGESVHRLRHGRWRGVGRAHERS